MVVRHKHIIVSIIFCLLACTSAYARKTKEVGVVNSVDVETTITAVSTADLNISEERVSMSKVWTLNFLSATSLEQRKANLIIELCRREGADILVDPQFTYTKRVLGGGKLTVSGYPAKYTNFRTMTDKEIDTFIVSPTYNTGKVVFINK